MILQLKQLDWILIISAILLISMGLLALYSGSLGREDFANFQKQLIFAGIGIFLMLVFYFSDYRVVKNDTRLVLIFYFLCILALIGLFFFASEIRGVKSWYKVGAISIDPSEFMKIILLVFLANYFSSRHIELYRLYHIIFSGFYVFLPAFLIAIQPNLGSALILISLWAITLLISGIKLKLFLLLCFCGLLLFAFGWLYLLQDYQKERIESFLIPASDPLGAGWNQNQAKIAIGSGGILGRGFGQGPQTQYGFLPEPETDFIFAAIAEEFGLVGIALLFFLIAAMISRIIKIAINAQSNFPRFFALGFASLLIAQIFINIGMNLGLTPVIGISLPLVSYGGSNLIVNLIGLGILLNIKKNQ